MEAQRHFVHTERKQQADFQVSYQSQQRFTNLQSTLTNICNLSLPVT